MSQYRRNDLADIAYLSTGRNNYRTRSNHLIVAIFLCHRQRVFTCRDIDTQFASKIGSGLNSGVQTGIFPFVAARPHPVGTQRNTCQLICQRSKDDVRQRFGNSHNRTGSRINHCHLRSMTDRGRDTSFSTVIQCYGTQVTQRQLQFTLTLLTGDLTCYGTVHLIGQPVLTCHSFQLKYVFQIMMQFRFFVNDRSICFFHRMILHDRSGRFTEHIFQLDIDRLHTVSLLEYKFHIVSRFTNHIHRRTFTVSDTSYAGHIFFFHQQAHTFLAFVTNYFFSRKRRVTDRQLAHIDMSACSFHQFRQTVQVTACTMVMDRNNRVIIRFGNGTNHIRYTFLHFRISTLHGIQFDTAGVLPRVYRRNSTTAHTDTIVVTTQQHHLFTRLRITLQSIAHIGITDTACQHDYLIISIFLIVFFMLESQHRTADQRLTELISEIGSSV